MKFRNVLLVPLLGIALSSAVVPLQRAEAQTTKQFVWWRGVNLAGGEYDESGQPGVLGTTYQYPNQKSVDYFSGKGMNVFRFPILWERIQPQLFDPFNQNEAALIDKFISETTAKGKFVILDPHNYGRYGQGRHTYDVGPENAIGSADVPLESFYDLWSRLAARYKNNNKVIFNLMNEPHDMPTETWVTAANGAIQAIRNQGAGNLILVPGNRYTGAWSWNVSDSNGESNAKAMLKIKDPYNWFWFDVHQYLDKTGSSVPDECGDFSTIGKEPLKIFTQWLKDNNKKGFLGEFGIAANPGCNAAFADMMKYVEDNGDVWRGWTYFGAGPFDTPLREGFTLEPVNGRDASQFNILNKYLPGQR
jgi:endoglucanase